MKEVDVEIEIADALRNDPEMIKQTELYSIISGALKDATEYGLQIEVVHSALKIMKDHPEVEIDAVINAAMVEWDIW